LPLLGVTVAAQRKLVSERGRPGFGAERRLYDAGKIDEPTVEKMDERYLQAGAEGARPYAEAAEAARDTAIDQAAVSTVKAGEAEDAAARAQMAEANVSAGMPFDTIAAGLAATAEGDTFAVFGPPPYYATTYRKVAGAAEVRGTFSSQEALEAKVLTVDPMTLVPIAELGGKVVLWLERGMLGAAGLAPSLQASALAEVSRQFDHTIGIRPVVEQGGRVAIWLDEAGDFGAKGMTSDLRRSVLAEISSPVTSAGQLIPIAELGGKVALWLERGLLGARGLAPSLLDSISTRFAPANYAGTRPLSTDGRTLGRVYAKLGMLLAGASVLVHIAFNADSWSDQRPIAEAIQAVLGQEFTILQAPGFVGVNEGTPLNGVTRTFSAGWTYTDGSATSTFPYGAGPDGKCMSTSAADQTYTVSNIVAKTIKIFYRNYGGTFRYRVDGGAWTTVVCPNDGSHGTVSLSGLAEVAHTLEIDTAGNAGVVALTGFAGLTDSPGIMISKWGNGGMTGERINAYAPYMAPVLAELGIDLNITVLGTNDYRGSTSTPALFTQALGNIFTALKSAVPDVGMIAMLPPQSGGTVVQPLSNFVDAALEWAKPAGAELLNLHDQLPAYSVTNGYGMWLDTLHLNDFGARWLADRLNHHFLHVKG
ncbi:SGNH/GDSL hydrolase family protein, partial [Sphingobium yanoikuyae]|uniref:SGNH/GDSL hydrolase family protein n=1 Tax=Sphingobium yanoikuyae TaxID=13690 RepID=UPI0028A7B02F